MQEQYGKLRFWKIKCIFQKILEMFNFEAKKGYWEINIRFIYEIYKNANKYQ